MDQDLSFGKHKEPGREEFYLAQYTVLWLAFVLLRRNKNSVNFFVLSGKLVLIWKVVNIRFYGKESQTYFFLNREDPQGWLTAFQICSNEEGIIVYQI